jgi:hypothetical protein
VKKCCNKVHVVESVLGISDSLEEGSFGDTIDGVNSDILDLYGWIDDIYSWLDVAFSDIESIQG